MDMETVWLKWVRRLQALAQSGLAFSEDPFDRDRYREVQDIAAEILGFSSGMDPAAAARLLDVEEGYATPKVDVRGGVFRKDLLLLVREKSDGLWTLPGGWADVGESPAEAVVREIREESGLDTKASKLVALYDRNKHGHPPMLFHVYKAFFLCDMVEGSDIRESRDPRGETNLAGGGQAPSPEISETGFFSMDTLPELSIARVTRRQLERLFSHHKDRTLPTEFD